MPNPRYPVYIPSKGRWDSRLTPRALDKIGVPYQVVVEPTEADAYRAVMDPGKVLVLPFADLGQGSVPARNWIWDHAAAAGHERHWILDDNIGWFCRFHNNAKQHVWDGTIFRAAEDFVDRFTNVPMAGFQYHGFANHRTGRKNPFLLNTRVYSCILLSNKIDFRWRGRYNEDTDLSLRLLKAGYCTILFYAFLAHKTETMTMKGGNSDELYKSGGGFDGRLEMARSLQRQHPDVVKVVRRWGRWQHFVDYRPFRRNRLRERPGLSFPEGPDEYGMRLVEVPPEVAEEERRRFRLPRGGA